MFAAPCIDSPNKFSTKLPIRSSKLDREVGGGDFSEMMDCWFPDCEIPYSQNRMDFPIMNSQFVPETRFVNVRLDKFEGSLNHDLLMCIWKETQFVNVRLDRFDMNRPCTMAQFHENFIPLWWNHKFQNLSRCATHNTPTSDAELFSNFRLVSSVYRTWEW